LLDLGLWRFKVLGENGDAVVAEPVEKLETYSSMPNVSKTKSSKQVFSYTGVADARLDTLLKEGRVSL
jgi:hypothetical protein